MHRRSFHRTFQGSRSTPMLAALALAAAPVIALLASPAALAQAARPPAEITITNARAVPLTVLEVATTGDNPRLVAKLPRALAPGQTTRVRMTRPAGCTYFVLARFADDVESESDGMDLCADRTIRLID